MLGKHGLFLLLFSALYTVLFVNNKMDIEYLFFYSELGVDYVNFGQFLTVSQ